MKVRFLRDWRRVAAAYRDIFRFAYSLLSEEDKAKVDQHLKEINS